MTTNSQLTMTEYKKQKQTKQTTRTGTESQKWRSHGGLSLGEEERGKGEHAAGWSSSYSWVPPILPAMPPTFSSYPWVIHISSLASPFPILFLTSPCLFCAYQLCFLFPVLFSHSPPSPSLLVTHHVISISVILLLFRLVCFCFCFFRFSY